MKKSVLITVALAMLVFAETTWATPTRQQNCDFARIKAYAAFLSCTDNVLARGAKGVDNAPYAGFANCRHAYFLKWNAFQNPHRSPSLAGSTCVGPRFTDNGDQTVTDNFSALVWEKKANLDSVANDADPHDADNTYAWSTGTPYNEDGAAFTDFLAKLNTGAGFGGANGWRLPTLVELGTTLLDFRCSGASVGPKCICPSSPCVDPTLDPANTQPGGYWCATTFVSATELPISSEAWTMGGTGGESPTSKLNDLGIRAVRGGL